MDVPGAGDRRRSRWILPARTQGTVSCRLFCLPYAGGGASVFRTWGAGLPDSIAVHAIQPPGREERVNEPPLTDLRELARELALELLPLLDMPYAVFGHSMGALFAYELLQQLSALRASPPRHLFLSSYLPPQYTRRWAPIHQLPDDEFLEEIRKLNGTPDAVLRHPELMALLLPTLRADFAACERYAPQHPVAMSWPVTVYGGTDDTDVPAELLAGWQLHTAASFRMRLFDGDHFFLTACRNALLDDIRTTLLPAPTPPPQSSETIG